MTIKMPRFGSAEWQDWMRSRVLKKFSAGKKLLPEEKAFIQIQLERSRRLL